MLFWALICLAAGIAAGETPLGYLLIFIGFGFLIHGVAKSVDRLDTPLNQNTEKNCPPHRWMYDDGGMICQLCRKRPGEIPSSYDKPY